MPITCVSEIMHRYCMRKSEERENWVCAHGDRLTNHYGSCDEYHGRHKGSYHRFPHGLPRSVRDENHTLSISYRLQSTVALWADVGSVEIRILWGFLFSHLLRSGCRCCRCCAWLSLLCGFYFRFPFGGSADVEFAFFDCFWCVWVVS
jgi:hypothetical protein